MTITTSPPEHLPLVDELRARQLPSRVRRKAIREAVGASISDIANACGVTHFAVRSWEKPGGTIEPKPKTRVLYKRLLDELEVLAQEIAAREQGLEGNRDGGIFADCATSQK